MEARTYQVVSSTDLTQLVRLVNDLITQAWQPVGGVAVVPSSPGSAGDCREYFQAMIQVDHRGR